MMPYSLLLALFIPLFFVPIAYFVGKALRRNTGWLVVAPFVVSLILLLEIAAGIWDGGSYSETYTWAPQAGLSFSLLADGLNIWVLLTITILCLGITIYSMPYMEHRFHEFEHEGEPKGPGAFGGYFGLYLLYAVGMLGTVMSTNLIEFYLFFELMLIPSWLLINNYGYGDRERIGMIYFMWTTLGAVILLAGILASYAITGSFDITSLSRVVGASNATWIFAAILFAFFTKMAVFGLHVWLPFAHAEAPTPISALLSPAMIGIGAYGAIRLVIIPMGGSYAATFSWVFTLWALVTMIYGGFMALTQDDIKRFLAYSSISQMGYIFLGLASATPIGEAGAIYQYVAHGLGKGILFCIAGMLISQAGTRSIKKMGGLADRMPIAAVLALIGFFTIGGVPPTIGFLSKFYIFEGVFAGQLGPNGAMQVWAAVIGIIMTVLTIGYGMWMVRRVFYGPLMEGLREVKEAPMAMVAPIVGFAILALILGIWPTLVTNYLSAFFS